MNNVDLVEKPQEYTTMNRQVFLTIFNGMWEAIAQRAEFDECKTYKTYDECKTYKTYDEFREHDMYALSPEDMANELYIEFDDSLPDIVTTKDIAILTRALFVYDAK